MDGRSYGLPDQGHYNKKTLKLRKTRWQQQDCIACLRNHREHFLCFPRAVYLELYGIWHVNIAQQCLSSSFRCMNDIICRWHFKYLHIETRNCCSTDFLSNRLFIPLWEEEKTSFATLEAWRKQQSVQLAHQKLKFDTKGLETLPGSVFPKSDRFYKNVQHAFIPGQRKCLRTCLDV